MQLTRNEAIRAAVHYAIATISAVHKMPTIPINIRIAEGSINREGFNYFGQPEKGTPIIALDGSKIDHDKQYRRMLPAYFVRAFGRVMNDYSFPASKARMQFGHLARQGKSLIDLIEVEYRTTLTGPSPRLYRCLWNSESTVAIEDSKELSSQEKAKMLESGAMFARAYFAYIATKAPNSASGTQYRQYLKARQAQRYEAYNMVEIHTITTAMDQILKTEGWRQ